MKTIYKYPILIKDYQKIEVPLGATFLSVALQNNILCLWALVDTEAPIEIRTIRIAGTGHELVENMVYIGSFLTLNDRLVFHVFDIVF